MPVLVLQRPGAHTRGLSLRITCSWGQLESSYPLLVVVEKTNSDLRRSWPGNGISLLAWRQERKCFAMHGLCAQARHGEVTFRRIQKGLKSSHVKHVPFRCWRVSWLQSCETSLLGIRLTSRTCPKTMDAPPRWGLASSFSCKPIGAPCRVPTPKELQLTCSGPGCIGKHRPRHAKLLSVGGKSVPYMLGST